MRAVVVTKYGGPEVLELTDVPAPLVAPGAVRVKVRAASVNPVDNFIREGYMQSYFSPSFPFVLGFDLAGTVDEVGPDVNEFAIGDEVVGHLLGAGLTAGAFAEMVASSATAFVPKLPPVDFGSAAAVPHAGLTADQALHEVLDVQSGETILIHAAAGGVGSFAIQLARRDDLRVLGTCLPHNIDYLRSLGAEPVRYDQDLVSQVRALAPDGVDAVLDLIGGAEGAQTDALLRPGGRLASTVDFGVAERGGTLVVCHPDRERLAYLLQLVADGELHVEIFSVLPLAAVPDALRTVAEGHVRGKIVIDVTA